MKVGFVKLSPTQNMTILVTTPVARDLQSRAADALMQYSNVYAEQVGFLEATDEPNSCIHLQMMGGEFCGNATMACASYMAMKRRLRDGSETDITIGVSGVDDPISCHVAKRGNAYFGTVNMPVPYAIREYAFSNGIVCPVVFFPGIAHAILEDNGEDDTAIIEAMCKELDVEAFGILRCSEELSRIKPLVYVASTSSAVYERGCGSGTSALIAYRAYVRKSDFYADISQPGGVIRARARYSNGKITLVEITGKVTIAATGSAYIDI